MSKYSLNMSNKHTVYQHKRRQHSNIRAMQQSHNKIQQLCKSEMRRKSIQIKCCLKYLIEIQFFDLRGCHGRQLPIFFLYPLTAKATVHRCVYRTEEEWRWVSLKTWHDSIILHIYDNRILQQYSKSCTQCINTVYKASRATIMISTDYICVTGKTNSTRKTSQVLKDLKNKFTLDSMAVYAE